MHVRIRKVSDIRFVEFNALLDFGRLFFSEENHDFYKKITFINEEKKKQRMNELMLGLLLSNNEENIM